MFSESEYRKSITIPIINDMQYEADVDFYVILKNPSGEAGISDPNITRITIIDDDGTYWAGVLPAGKGWVSTSDLGPLMGGPQCRMSNLRNVNVPCHFKVMGQTKNGFLSYIHYMLELIFNVLCAKCLDKN